MFKFIGSLIIVISFSAFGIINTSRLKKRCESLMLLLRCTKHIGTEIAYSKKRCELILDESAKIFNLPLLHDVCTMISEHGINTAFNKAFGIHKEAMALKDEDIIAASGISSLFSYCANESESGSDAVIKMLELAFNDANNNYLKNAKLYKSGSILCGVLTAILLF